MMNRYQNSWCLMLTVDNGLINISSSTFPEAKIYSELIKSRH